MRPSKRVRVQVPQRGEGRYSGRHCWPTHLGTHLPKPEKPSGNIKRAATGTESASVPAASVEAAPKLTPPGQHGDVSGPLIVTASDTNLQTDKSTHPKGAGLQIPSVRVWGKESAHIPRLNLQVVHQQAPIESKRTSWCWCPRLPTVSGPNGTPRSLDGEEGVSFYTNPSRKTDALSIFDKPRQAHARSWDWRAAGWLARIRAVCNATPVDVPGSGPREGPSVHTTLHSVGGARPLCGQSELHHWSLRSENIGGKLQSSKRAAAMQTLPEIRPQPVQLCGLRRRAHFSDTAAPKRPTRCCSCGEKNTANCRGCSKWREAKVAAAKRVPEERDRKDRVSTRLPAPKTVPAKPSPEEGNMSQAGAT
jgi:hypothetical protein